MAKNETDSGLFVALNYFSHLTLCLSEKMRRCFKRSDIFEKTSDFFRSLAVTDFTTLESGLKEIWVEKMLSLKKFCLKKTFGSKKSLSLKKILGMKNFLGPKYIFGSKINFLSKIDFGSKINVGSFNLKWYPIWCSSSKIYLRSQFQPILYFPGWCWWCWWCWCCQNPIL